MPEGCEFLVLAGLKLLVFVAVDLILLGLDLDLQFLALNLDFTLATARGLEAFISDFQFTLAGGFFSRKGRDFREDGFQLLVSILKCEEFFDFREHGDERWGKGDGRLWG